MIWLHMVLCITPYLRCWLQSFGFNLDNHSGISFQVRFHPDRLVLAIGLVGVRGPPEGHLEIVLVEGDDEHDDQAQGHPQHLQEQGQAVALLLLGL